MYLFDSSDVDLLSSLVPSSAVRNVSTTSPTSTSIHVSWSVPIPNDLNGDLTHYTVTYYGEEIDTHVRIVQLNTSSLGDMNVTLTDLEEYTIYSINISVYTKVGRGPDFLTYQRTIEDGMFSFYDYLCVFFSSFTSVKCTFS